MSKIKVKAIQNWVIIEPIKNSEKTESGLYIPNNEKTPTMQGTVLSVGPGIPDSNGNVSKPPVEEGRIVLYPKGSGRGIKYEGVKYIMLKFEDVLLALK